MYGGARPQLMRKYPTIYTKLNPKGMPKIAQILDFGSSRVMQVKRFDSKVPTATPPNKYISYTNGM